MQSYFQRTTSAAPLATFRIAFGLLIFAGVIRFWAKGWIHDLYVAPKHFFPFYGFEFIVPPGQFSYLLFAICGLSALFVALGFFYRVSIVTLFASFTYIELIDKSTYLNHYYFVSMMCLLLIFLPAHRSFSLDAYRTRTHGDIFQWQLDSVKLFVCLVYFFAGLAKVNSEWLLHAQPLRIWLPAKNDLPLIGFIFNKTWTAYAFSWAGCLYDLTIPFLLLYSPTRVFAYGAVVIFHVLTAMLFPIGMFPYIMIVTALIFFSPKVHEKILFPIRRLLQWRQNASASIRATKPTQNYAVIALLSLFFAFQLITPFRYLAYPGELFWTEEGYRFSWRVMLMEKAGNAQFIVKDRTGRQVVAENSQFLTPLQEKMMATQPDMILTYAHMLRDHYSKHGFDSPEVYVDSYVVLNGRLGKPLIDPSTNLAREK
ncbi:MAG TPA: HTTM domain-containing protein, partial [Sphingobacteriaceae bacterium]